MFRTIKVSLPFEQSLLQTAIAFNNACQKVLNYGSEHKVYNKNMLNKATYPQVRREIPNLPSALVQTARDEASEMLLRTDFAKVVKKRLSVRYDNRCFKFYPDSNHVSLTTVMGRLTFHFKHYRLFVNEPNVASGEASSTGVVDDSYKPMISVIGN